MLSVRHLSILHQQDLRPLVSDLSFTVSAQDKLAIIGEEGNGKSTLLKLLYQPALTAGYAQFTGTIDRGNERMAYLPQELPKDAQQMPVYAFFMQSDAFLETDPREINTLCALLHLPQELCYADCAMQSLSGGEKIKLQLLLLLCSHPTMLLLDEPTNDLDLSALAFLEQFIRDCKLPILYISHDETLLSRTATRVLHLELAHHKKEPRWTLANMDYDAYMAQRAQKLLAQEHQAQMEKREERIRQQKFERILNAVDHAQASISRADPHGGRLLKKKMKAVKSLEHRYDRERAQQTDRPNIEYAIDASFSPITPLPAAKVVLDMQINRLCAGDKEQLTRLRTYLGAFKFSTEEMSHPVRELSGGQKAKLFFLQMILQDANVLLLDEPTRNLSPLSAPVIRTLMLDYPGAILAVTHDRLLMHMWPGRILKMSSSGLIDVTSDIKST